MKRARITAFAVCLLISAVESQPFSVLVTKNVMNATAGDRVILSVRPSSPVVSGFWKFGAASIVAWTVEPPDLNIAYTKRNVELLFNTSLLMRSVAVADSGEYRVTMDSPAGKEATAKITLNVFPKPAPFTISAECSEINATAGDDVVLSVTPSEEVNNGSWKFGGKEVARWMGTFPEISAGYRRRAAIFGKASLQLKSVSVSDTGEYSVTMTTASGSTRTAKVYLNVFTEPQPISISVPLSKINAERRANVLLSVAVSGKMKKGNWSIRGWLLFQWNGPIENATEHPYSHMMLLPNASLLLHLVSIYSSNLYTVTVESPTGATATANITLKVFRSSETCTSYNVLLSFSILLAVICIFAFAIHIHKKNQTVGYETIDLLAVCCKGYRFCLSLVTLLAFNFIIIFAVLINKNMCVPGQVPVFNFLAK